MVRLLGPPKIRQHPRLRWLRWKSLHLARIRVHLDEGLRFCLTHRIRKHNLLVTPRIWLSPRLRLL
jgi:hypothetical protein